MNFMVKTETSHRKGSKPKNTLMKIGIICFLMPMAQDFTTYYCHDQSNVVESYSLLNTDACPTSDGNGEIETTGLEKSFR